MTMKLEELINKLREVGEDLGVWLTEHLTKIDFHLCLHQMIY